MIDEKTINSVNKIVSVLGDAASISLTYGLGMYVKGRLCSPNVKITDFIVSAAILGLDFKICTLINNLVNEVFEDNKKVLKKSGENCEN